MGIILKWICSLLCRKRSVKNIFVPINNLYEWNDFERQLFNEINLYRSENNIKPLIADKFCKQQTDLRNVYCMYRQKITHEQMGVAVNNAKKEGLQTYRENLALKYTSTDSVLKAWINSNPHNKTLLHKKSVYAGVSSSLGENSIRYTTFGLFY